MTHTTHTGEFLPAAHGVILNPGGVNKVTMAPWHTNTWIAITFPGSLSPTCFLPKNVFLILDDFSLCHSTSYVFVLSTFLVVILPSNPISRGSHTSAINHIIVQYCTSMGWSGAADPGDRHRTSNKPNQPYWVYGRRGSFVLGPPEKGIPFWEADHGIPFKKRAIKKEFDGEWIRRNTLTLWLTYYMLLHDIYCTVLAWSTSSTIQGDRVLTHIFLKVMYIFDTPVICLFWIGSMVFHRLLDFL